VLARLALSRKVNSVAMEAHPGAMEYQPGILEAPTELLSTVASPGAVVAQSEAKCHILE